MFQRPVHFEIHASDPAVSSRFYSELFGWQTSQWGDQPYWLVITGDGNMAEGRPDTVPGINGALLPREGGAPGPDSPVNGWVVIVEVGDAYAISEQAVALGGQVALPVEHMPGVGHVGYLKDPDGNIFGVLSEENGEG